VGELGYARRHPKGVSRYLQCGGEYRLAIKLLAQEPRVLAALAGSAGALPPAKPAAVAKPSAYADRARLLYAQAGEITGTPVEDYLVGRRLYQTDAWADLRASRVGHPSGRRYWSLIAPFTTLDGTLVGLLRTFVQLDGTKLTTEPARMMLGTIRGTAIQLGEPATDLIICEGLEDELPEPSDGERKAPGAGASAAGGLLGLMGVEADEEDEGDHNDEDEDDD
jgi:hypothetical protein